MAKYCVRCGKPLPKGAEVCPDCAAEMQDDAALFTRMTTETEVWKSAEPVKRKKYRTIQSRSRRSILTACIGGGLVLIVVLVMVLLLRPAARVTRAIRGGDYQRAYEIYWSTPRLSGRRVDAIDKAIWQAADKLCRQFADHEIDADTAASQLSLLGGFGDGAAEMLEELYDQFRNFNSSQEHMETAEALFRDGAYLDAREEFLLVEPGDADYDAAQVRAADCLSQYGADIAAQAETRMAESDFPGALRLLKEGDSTLYALNTFSEAIDSTQVACYDRYEQFLLEEAERLAELEDYDAAVERISAAMADFGSPREALTKAVETYELQARDKHIADAGTLAETRYETGDFAGAFAVLEEIRAQDAENEAGTDALIEALETRFAADRCAQARERFAGERDNLPDAIAILDEALEVRDLEPIQTYRDDLAQYLPLSLVTAEYATKNGTVFRSDSDFTGLDGAVYDGWVWGENGAEISFALDGAYDVFRCSFAVRREDSANANGRFQLWCDGEQVYESEKLYHWQTEPQNITVDVRGCKELKLVFVCDYTVSTAENGYCYHGLCEPFLTKDMP